MNEEEEVEKEVLLNGALEFNYGSSRFQSRTNLGLKKPAALRMKKKKKLQESL